jgi:ribosomal protein S14
MGGNRAQLAPNPNPPPTSKGIKHHPPSTIHHPPSTIHHHLLIEGVLKLVDRLVLGPNYIKGSSPFILKMQALIKKNKKFRTEYKKNEINYYIISALTKNKILTNSDKTIISLQYTAPYLSKVRNLCLITGRSRALIQDYKLSRLKFKELAEAGYLSGIKKK